MARIQGTIHQVRRLRDEELKLAEKHLTRAVKARKDAQDSARRLQERQWDAALLAITDPERARKLAEYHPYLERDMLRDLGIARDAEEKGEFHLALAKRAVARVDRLTRRASRRQTPGLWILLQTCLRGHQSKRALR